MSELNNLHRRLLGIHGRYVLEIPNVDALVVDIERVQARAASVEARERAAFEAGCKCAGEWDAGLFTNCLAKQPEKYGATLDEQCAFFATQCGTCMEDDFDEWQASKG